MEYSLDKAIPILQRTPAIVKTLLQVLPPDWTMENEGPETWSPYDIIGHYIHGEKTDWIPRARIILGATENKTFEPYDRFAQFENSKGQSLHQLLDEFTHLRAQNIVTLKKLNITPQQLEYTGIHPELGVVTLKQLLSAWVVHDLGHITQIARVMAKQYKEAVGPWSAYLSVVH